MSTEDRRREEGYIEIKAAEASAGDRMWRNCAGDGTIGAVDNASSIQTVITVNEEDGDETTWSYLPSTSIWIRPRAA